MFTLARLPPRIHLMADLGGPPSDACMRRLARRQARLLDTLGFLHCFSTCTRVLGLVFSQLGSLHRYYLDYDCRPSGPRANGTSSSACPLGCIAISSGVRSSIVSILLYVSTKGPRRCSPRATPCVWRWVGRAFHASVSTAVLLACKVPACATRRSRTSRAMAA